MKMEVLQIMSPESGFRIAPNWKKEMMSQFC